MFIIQSYTQINEFQIESQIYDSYETIFNRQPSQLEIENLKNEIINEKKSIDTIREELMTSTEGIVTKQITDIYETILLRDPDSQGLIHWKNAMINDGKTINWVEEMIRNSIEIRSLNN